MKASMVIPTYWSKSSSAERSIDEEIYDHPTPLNKPGTLARALGSIKKLKNRDFQLVVVIAPTSDDIEQEATVKVEEIVRSVSSGVNTIVFGPTQLRRVHEILVADGRQDDIDLLSLRGYSNIRNLCLFLPHILGSDIVILIDDDEIFEDSDFTAKMRIFIGKEYKSTRVNAVAGYYLQQDGDYHIKKAAEPWMKHWGQYQRMNEAFDMVIGREPRLKETPFVFGGNMVIHRNLFSQVPFDPGITRGEDIDYLINVRMFGFSFFLDNRLSIKHLPPPKTHPVWLQLRQDIYRFIYEKAKLENQKDIKGMTRINAEDLDPYPGFFLKKNLMERIETTCELMSQAYIERGDSQGSREALNNISLAKVQIASLQNPFDSLCQLQQRWQMLMEYARNNNLLASIIS
ncbi:MAG: glycosyltransferase [Dehalococcoidia bacterium]|nr:MAG: glycosyltransferase [Dehalococcoidia bacterium]